VIGPERDPQFINRIANSAAVRPFVDYRGVEAPLDLTPAIGRPAEVGIVWLSNKEDALVAFAMTGDREYQAHVFFDGSCRGRRAIETAKEMVEWMAPHADRLWGAIPMRNRAARWFGRQVGFKHESFDEYEAEGPVEIVTKARAH
jgi:hypothetical protein